LFYRLKNDYAAKNPLTDKIKTSYTLIYDIAAFIAQELKDTYDLSLNEDEIAFISFHIGAYFEENSFINSTQVNCAFIYSDYYDFYKVTVEKIASIFKDKIAFKMICPVNDFSYEQVSNKIDLVIATTLSKGSIPEDRIVYIKPFLKEDDINTIQKKVSTISYEKNKAELNDYILSFFSPKLFYNNLNPSDKYELIKDMCADLLKEGFTDDSFYDDVITREQLSSTSFHDAAVPHAFSSTGTRRSFISIALFPEGIDWGKGKKVKIVAMIGANKNSSRIFSQFFEQIIAILDNPENVTTLINSKDFGDFYNRIVRIFNA